VAPFVIAFTGHSANITRRDTVAVDVIPQDVIVNLVPHRRESDGLTLQMLAEDRVLSPVVLGSLRLRADQCSESAVICRPLNGNRTKVSNDLFRLSPIDEAATNSRIEG
jgi:hypothetical protein